MDLDDGGVDHGELHIRIIRYSLEMPLENIGLHPVAIALEDRVPLAEKLRKVAPRTASARDPKVLTNLEAWIRRRLRLYLWRQWRTRQNRFAELRRRGVAKFPAAVAAGSPTGLWRMSGHPAVQQAVRNAYFESLALPRIYTPAQA